MRIIANVDKILAKKKAKRKLLAFYEKEKS